MQIAILLVLILIAVILAPWLLAVVAAISAVVGVWLTIVVAAVVIGVVGWCAWAVAVTLLRKKVDVVEVIDGPRKACVSCQAEMPERNVRCRNCGADN